ncbi:F-box/FBD/LRR-repeat protein At3g26920 isoform X1 [Aegilops tauschii subsp. strangulata]|nr:F-box/FBD/LRR-repeat protein At3g26920 isoform X1 [Aegilops tauschii subsp. strangulata]
MDDAAAAAAACASKKRRRKEPVPQNPPPSTEGGGDDANLDLISRLPDEILGTIISLLPSTKGAARTAILSSRWRHLWRSAPLNLSVDFVPYVQERDQIANISKILAAHPGPARRLSFSECGHIRLRPSLYDSFDGWFRSSALDGLEELDLYGNDNCPLPLSVLRFAPTLCVAKIYCCAFPEIEAAAPALSFPRLKQLKLHSVSISETTLHRLLAGCTALEALQLHHISGLSTVRIVSPTVRSISVSGSHSILYNEEVLLFSELVIEDAPCLERLIPYDVPGPRTVRVIAAPKLTVLGCLSREISNLVIGTIIVKDMIPISFTAAVRTVKVLALQSIGLNLNAIVGFLRCFPCIEKLYIQSWYGKDMKNELQYGALDPIECLDLHLREIVLMGYRGNRADTNFAKFFVLNEKVVKVMRFAVYEASVYSKGRISDSSKRKWMANHRTELQLDKRASRGARFDFIRNSVAHGLHYNKHIHDMWMSDPFDSSLCKCCSRVVPFP